MASQVWSNGTELQRATMAGLYGEMTQAILDDGALYAGVCYVGMDDSRISTASVVARLDAMSADDPEIVACGLSEAIAQVTTEVSVTKVPVGPCVVSFHASEWAPGESLAPVGLARVDAQIPLPEIARLLTLSLSTPSLPELPVYVNVLSSIAESVTLSSSDHPSATAAEAVTTQRCVADDIRSVFG